METLTNIISVENNNNFNNINNSSSLTKKYWCHLCRKEFFKVDLPNIDVACSYCGNTFCEIIENDDTNNDLHPINFHPYVLNNSAISNNNNISNNNRNNNALRRRHRIIEHIFSSRNILRPRYSRNLLDFIMNFAMIQNYNDDIDNIINQLMLNDTNKYGNPPAAKNAIEKLEKCKISDEKLKEFGIENSCAVCKDEFVIGQECLLMPCKHRFHGDCLLPWLNERNSCPVCRYELPTDDEDFEQRKKQKLNNNISSSGQGVNITNVNSSQ